MNRCELQSSWFISFAILFVIRIPVAIASEYYDELFSYRYEEMTDYELSEDGLRDALRDFDELDIYQSTATIDVIGERGYNVFVDQLKSLYSRSPEDNPNPSDPESVARYSNEMFLDKLKVHAVRALIRCGDSDAEEYAIEQALRAAEMTVETGAYAVRNLKYLVKEFGTDITPELTFLIENQPDEIPGGIGRALIATRELVEVEHYLRSTDDPSIADCTKAIDAIKSKETSDVQREIELRRSHQPSWNVSKSIIKNRESGR